MKFSRKMYLMKILKATKKQGFTPSLGNIVLEKPQEWGKIEHLNILGRTDGLATAFSRLNIL